MLQIGGQFWGLGQHGGIHIAYPVSPLTEAGNHLVQQPQAIRPRVGRVAVREQVPDISKGAGAQQGVHHRVGEHIRVGVTQQALVKGHLHTAQNQPPALHQAVYVISMSNSHCCSLQAKSASATARSSGVVIFKLQ